MVDLNKEKNLSQESKVEIDPNLATIKSYLEANGIDSSWVEKSSYMRDNFSRGTSPFEYTVFYFDEKSNELKSRIKDVRGPSDENSERQITFSEYGNVVAMESLGRAVFSELFQADQYLAAGDYDNEPEKYKLHKSVYYLDKVDGTFLAREDRSSKAYTLSQDDITDVGYSDVSYDVNEEGIEARISESPSKYALVGNIMQIKKTGEENERLKRDNASLSKMLGKTLKFAERIRDSRIGYLFFRKDVNEVLGVENKKAKRLQDGHSGQGEDRIN